MAFCATSPTQRSETSVFDLEQEVTAWADELVTAEPSLEPVIDELIDHVRTSVESRMAANVPGEEAFASAIGQFDQPEYLAREFRRTCRAWPAALLAGEIASTDNRQAHRYIAVAWILMSLAWATAMVLMGQFFEGNYLNWLTAGWVLTTFLPLSTLQARLSAR